MLLGAFACRSPFELLWLSSFASYLGETLQQPRVLGRLETLGLYVACGLASSLSSAYLRRSARGAGGLLGACAYHALALPHARHSFFGLELNARMAVVAQFVLASWGGGAIEPVPILLVNGVPALLGALAFFARHG